MIDQSRHQDQRIDNVQQVKVNLVWLAILDSCRLGSNQQCWLERSVLECRDFRNRNVLTACVHHLVHPLLQLIGRD